MRVALALLAALGGAAASATCDKGMDAACGSVRQKCASFPCSDCQACIITNSAALSKDGCTAQEELAFCASPPPPPPPPPPLPPGTCAWTDSHGDTYDVSGIPRVDGKWTTIDNRPVWYHVGVCGPPTFSDEPEVGCGTLCQDVFNCPTKGGIDQGGEGVCQYDPALKPPVAVEYNCGTAASKKFVDGPVQGRSVALQFTGGSSRGGCGETKRRTTVVVKCDPCSFANISVVTEPDLCHYQTEITSTAGCPTNRPLPSATCPHLCDTTARQCKKVPAGTPGANSTLGECLKTCVPPTPKPTPPPTPAPTPAPTPSPPLFSVPCIRVGHVIPVAELLDIEIVQGNRSYSWTNYGFGDFSNWTSHFEVGTGTVNLFDSKTGKKLLSVKNIPLTPGPLVVVAKCPPAYTPLSGHCWPPQDEQLGGSVETIAASFDPLDKGSAVRFVNLSPDTSKAGMLMGGKQVFDDIAYGLSPPSPSWVDIPTQSATFAAYDDTLKKTICSKTLVPPGAPTPFTNWLIGNGTTTDSRYAARLEPKPDAPNEGITCQGDLSGPLRVVSRFPRA
eukprot:TRINITY_DN1606_c0_g1_i6.p1 TRINITY_DN1606_c0_g1~~TRINITY_DN1606_c0_g1_i6.p1  ORF type:complete len:560 (+),score=155.88 TRINITY_DN1606_c0_g1_i6:101-1780(+)